VAGSLVATYTDADTGGAALSVSVPSLLFGDTVVVICATAYASAEPTPSSADVSGSFVELGSALGNEAANEHQHLRAWKFDCTSAGTNAGAGTFGADGDNEGILIVLHCRGVYGTTPSVSALVDSQDGGVATTQTLPAVSGTSGGLLIGAWAAIKFGSYTWGAISSAAAMTDAAELADPSGAMRMVVATAAIGSTASTGTRSSTASASIDFGFAGKLIALPPGDPANTGALSASIPLQVAALAGDTVLSGALAGVIPLQSASLAGDVAQGGALSASIPLQVAALAGTVVDQYEGALAGAIPLQVAALAGDVVVSGALAASIPLQVAALTNRLPLRLALPLRAGAAVLEHFTRAGQAVLETGLRAGSAVVERGPRAGTPTTDAVEPAGYGTSIYGVTPYGG
jgi:hypothetical protein